ncbi:BfmA/BtgA family mobilization protein [Sphingobacterium sp. HJSM2_6]|uniref:BfmA/BtgA family mobilization protein n=1 Tax=Sphingobacterium sp. HJSM2_6 TaxID=3366264 RepID=UPI003BD96542
MEQWKEKSIRFPQKSDDQLSALVLKFGRSKKLFLVQMIDYFYRSKKDPADSGDEILKRELSFGINRILSFIKQQEKDLLIPVMNLNTENFRLLNVFHEKLHGQDQLLTDQRQRIENILQEVNYISKGISKNKTDKAILISNIIMLFDRFLKVRDAIGWSLNSAKKDELYKKLISDIHKL